MAKMVKVRALGEGGIEIPGYGFFRTDKEFELPEGLADSLQKAGAMEIIPEPVKPKKKDMEVKKDGM